MKWKSRTKIIVVFSYKKKIAEPKLKILSHTEIFLVVVRKPSLFSACLLIKLNDPHLLYTTIRANTIFHLKDHRPLPMYWPYICCLHSNDYVKM